MFRFTLSASAIVHVVTAWYLCIQPERVKEVSTVDAATVAFLRLTLKHTVDTESSSLFEESDAIEQILPPPSLEKVTKKTELQDSFETESIKAPDLIATAPEKSKSKPVKKVAAPRKTPSIVQTTQGKDQGATTNAIQRDQTTQGVGKTTVVQSQGAPSRLTKKAKRALQMGYWKSLNAHFQSTNFNYPKRALLAGLEGKVYILIEVDRLGNIIAARINRSSGHQILDEAALKRVLATKRLPPLPSQLGNRNRKFRIPFEYRLPT